MPCACERRRNGDDPGECSLGDVFTGWTDARDAQWSTRSGLSITSDDGEPSGRHSAALRAAAVSAGRSLQQPADLLLSGRKADPGGHRRGGVGGNGHAGAVAAGKSPPRISTRTSLLFHAAVFVDAGFALRRFFGLDGYASLRNLHGRPASRQLLAGVPGGPAGERAQRFAGWIAASRINPACRTPT